jgi:hypothetical protein
MRVKHKRVGERSSINLTPETVSLVRKFMERCTRQTAPTREALIRRLIAYAERDFAAFEEFAADNGQ